MANIKISALTTYTGSATDLRWFVMNNSGNTETTKFSGYTSQLIPGTGTNSLRHLNSDATVSGPYGFLWGNSSNSITNTSGSNGVILGGINNQIAGGNFNSIIASFNSQASGDNTGSVISAYDSNITGAAYRSLIAASWGGNIGAVSDSAAIIGTQACTINGFRVIIGASFNSTISRSNTLVHSFIFGGENHTLSSLRSGILGGDSNIITATTVTDSLILGGRSRTATASATTYVENLHVFRTPSTEVQSEVSGTSVTVNLNNGGFSQLYISANTTVDITNVRDGQSFSIKTRTNGNYTTTWTATGYTFQFEGGNNQPGNTVTDIFDFQVFGTVIYGSRKHNYS